MVVSAAGPVLGVTHPDALYLQRVSVLLPGMHQRRAREISQRLDEAYRRLEDLTPQPDAAQDLPGRVGRAGACPGPDREEW